MLRTTHSPLLVFLLSSVLSSALAFSLGCGATTSQAKPTTTLVRPTPVVVTDATYPDHLRAFHRMALRAPERAALRLRLSEHLLSLGDTAIAADDYDEVVKVLGQLSDLYTPREWSEVAWPSGLERIAHYLIKKGSPRGDEARVLSGYLILALLSPDDVTKVEEYKKLVRWGFSARSDMSGPLERFEGLVEAWEKHARLTPLPEVLETLVRLYVERRDALVQLFQSTPDEQMPLSTSIFQGVQRTTWNVAAVYLRHGDTATALSNVRALGNTGGIEERLAEFLEATREEGTEGAGALLDLSRFYLEGGRADVARALCLDGLRTRTDDARFPQCLARIAATENDYGGALAWYADTISMLPNERAIYDEILEVLNGLIEQGLLRADSGATRAVCKRATEILQERMRRFPKVPPPVAPEQLYAAIALAEMNAGNASDAERYFRESVKAQPTAAALQQLGILLQRTGRPDQAAEELRKALALVPDDAEEAERKQAELYENLGDALRLAGHADESKAAYEAALVRLDALTADSAADRKARRIGMAHLRRGIVLGRLGKHVEARAAFTRAMDQAPGMRETYATILSYLVVAPDAAFAREVFQAAQNQLSLPPEWKVYFALWVRMISARAGQKEPEEISALFDSLKGDHDWWSKLASFGAGKLGYPQLVEEADGIGERAEATFYEGARLLSQGKATEARPFFDRVLESRMVAFYEFAMAQELLLQSAPLPAGVGPQPAASR